MSIKQNNTCKHLEHCLTHSKYSSLDAVIICEAVFNQIEVLSFKFRHFFLI